MDINFPNNPATNDTFEVNGLTYLFDGVKWSSIASAGAITQGLVVTAATTTNLSGTYNTGTLTASSNGALIVDGVTVEVGDNIFLKDQTNKNENGSYTVNQTGDASNPWIIERCDFCNESDEIPGLSGFVIDGNTNANTGWVFTVADPSTFELDVDDIIVVQFFGEGTYTAGTGLTLNGTQFNNVGVLSVNNNSGDVTVQETLVSGTNIKTVDGNSILGSGDVTINNKTITLSGDVSGSGTNSINVQLGSNVVGANELNVSGSGTTGQVLSTDGDGSFSWIDIGGGGLFQETSTSGEWSTTTINSATLNGNFIANGNVDASAGEWIKVPVVRTSIAQNPQDKVWTTSDFLNIGRERHAGAGTQSAGLAFGGRDANNNYTTSTEEYDGTSWSFGGNLNTAREQHAGAGTQSAGLAFGGRDDSFNTLNSTEEYDGTSWSSGGNLNTAREEHAGAGSQTAALAFGGRDDNSLSASTEEYNISSTSVPTSGEIGEIRFNVDNGKFEGYDGSQWSPLN